MVLVLVLFDLSVVHKQYINNVSLIYYLIKNQLKKSLVEQRIAKFHQREDAILYISCFDANAGIFETLLKEQDYIISVSSLFVFKWIEKAYRKI